MKEFSVSWSVASELRPHPAEMGGGWECLFWMQIIWSHLKLTGLERGGRVPPGNLHFNNLTFSGAAYAHLLLSSESEARYSPLSTKLAIYLRILKPYPMINVLQSGLPCLQGFPLAGHGIHTQALLCLLYPSPEQPSFSLPGKVVLMPNGPKGGLHSVFHIIDVWIPQLQVWKH